MGLPNEIITGLMGSSGYSGYEIDQSMLLDGSSDYLSWTPSGAGSDSTRFTFSCFFKKCSTGKGTILNAGTSSTSFTSIGFTSGDQLEFAQVDGSTVASVSTNQLFRDFGSWYHVVIIYNSNEASSADRIKIIVNGIELSFVEVNAIDSARAVDFASTDGHSIGRRHAQNDEFFDGYIAEPRYQDGVVESDATTFGEFWSGNDKAWRPTSPSGLTYGTNGFYLPFDTASASTPLSNGVTPTSSETTLSGSLSDLTDGSISDGYRSTTDPHTDVSNATFDFDLTTAQEVNVVSITGRSNATCNYKVSYSDNGSDWTDTGTTFTNVTTTTTEDSGVLDFTSDAAGAHRYWRLTVISCSSGTSGFGYYEMRLHASAGAMFGLGADSSGQANHWDTSGSPVQSSDSPTVNGCVLNALIPNGQVVSSWNMPTLSNGNLTAAAPGGGNYVVSGSIGFDAESDHIAFEGELDNATAEKRFGIADNAGNCYWYSDTGNVYDQAAVSQGGTWSTATTGDVITVRIDNGSLYFYKNGTIENSGTAAVTGLTGTWFPIVAVRNGTGAQASARFIEADFEQSMPSGALPLTGATITDPTITDPGENFNVVGYTASNSTQSIDGVGFQPDWTWHKNRTEINRHALFDVLRGATNRLASDNTDAEVADVDTLTSFDSDGFSIGADAGQYGVNDNGSQEFITWCWKAGGSGVTNTDGSTSSTVSVNDDAGFSIATWASPLSATTVGHGQSAAPELIIAREYDGVMSWRVYHKDIGNAKYLLLDTTVAETATTDWNSTNPTNSVFSVSNRFNTAGNYIAYCFRSIPGYSKVFSYTGNGSASDGSFVYLGFKPRFVMTKIASGTTGSWSIKDSERNKYNVADGRLYADGNAAEIADWDMDLLSNGFKWYDGGGATNGNGYTYVGIAFAENPFGGSNVPLGLAR